MLSIASSSQRKEVKAEKQGFLASFACSQGVETSQMEDRLLQSKLHQNKSQADCWLDQIQYSAWDL